MADSRYKVHVVYGVVAGSPGDEAQEYRLPQAVQVLDTQTGEPVESRRVGSRDFERKWADAKALADKLNGVPRQTAARGI